MIRMERRGGRGWRIAGMVLLGTVGLGTWAGAQNLVANGDFDVGQGLASWTGFLVQPEWSQSDWLGEVTSGSARLTNLAQCGGVFIYQCVEVPQPLAASYELGAAVLQESPLAQGVSQVIAMPRNGAGCGGTDLVAFVLDGFDQQGTWVSRENTAIVLPPATLSVQIRLAVTKIPFQPVCVPPQNWTVIAGFDHVRFGPTGTTPVTLQSVSIE